MVKGQWFMSNVEQQKALDESLRGFYSNSFFHIYMDGEFNTTISNIVEQKDKGTALHEYTHYLQNIGTLWGLYCSIQHYEIIIEFKKAILASNEIKRPFKFDLPEELKRKEEYIRHGDGTRGYPKWNIDENKPIDIELKQILVNGKQKEQVNVTFSLKEGKTETLQLGAHIIKESMAALYQSLLDPTAEHDDVPYSLVRIIARKHFPQIAKDTKKLICCCHTSLYSMSPGSSLIELLQEAEAEPSINGFELFDRYVHTKEVTTGKGVTKSMIDFFNDLVAGFKKMLGFNLVTPLDYISTVLDRVRLDGKYYPFLSVLYEHSDFSENDFTELIGYYGIPYIQTSNYGIHHPQGNGIAGEEGSMDVLELIVQEALYRSFVDPDKMYCCPLYYMCQGTSYEKLECFGNPWEGNMCSYTIVSDALKLREKKIEE